MSTAAAHDWIECDSPAGPVFVAFSGGRVSGLLIVNDRNRRNNFEDFKAYMRELVGVDVSAVTAADSDWAAALVEALLEGRTDMPVDLSSRPPFHRAALRAAAEIPKGEVRTYAEVAAAAGRPGAARAVGQAMARNPVPLLLPCHRVVPSAGGVGQYGYGPDLKKRLLSLEGAAVRQAAVSA